LCIEKDREERLSMLAQIHSQADVGWKGRVQKIAKGIRFNRHDGDDGARVDPKDDQLEDLEGEEHFR
jgi:hypothetical protein